MVGRWSVVSRPFDIQPFCNPPQDIHDFLGCFEFVVAEALEPDFKKKLLPSWSLWCKALADAFIMGFNEAQHEAEEQAKAKAKGSAVTAASAARSGSAAAAAPQEA